MMTKRWITLGLTAGLLLGTASPVLSSSGGVGNLLGAVGQLVGNTSVNTESGASLTAGHAVVTAKAANSTKQTGLTGLVGGALLGGTSNTSASVAYAGYSASTSANSSWGVASISQLVGNLLQGLAHALSGSSGS